jgi:hypothetical protein
MSRRVRGGGSDLGKRDIQSLEMMLDYAIIEGAELRLPLFVLLLRTARLELTTSIERSGGTSDRRAETKIMDCLGPDNAGSFPAPGEGPQNRVDIFQD